MKTPARWATLAAELLEPVLERCAGLSTEDLRALTKAASKARPKNCSSSVFLARDMISAAARIEIDKRKAVESRTRARRPREATQS